MMCECLCVCRRCAGHSIILDPVPKSSRFTIPLSYKPFVLDGISGVSRAMLGELWPISARFDVFSGMCSSLHDASFDSRFPTFLNNSPTILRAEIRADVVRGVPVRPSILL